jgi:AbrB family looped-hinge helix DNA binding protein
MRTTVRLSTKGQLILPKPVRDRFGWRAGTELLLEEQGSRLVVEQLSSTGPRTWDDLLGAAGYEGPKRSLAEMKRAVAAEARARR